MENGVQKLLSLQEVADLAHVTTQTVRVWIRRRKITASKIGGRYLYITPEEWNDFVKRSEVKVSDRAKELMNE